VILWSASGQEEYADNGVGMAFFASRRAARACAKETARERGTPSSVTKHTVTGRATRERVIACLNYRAWSDGQQEIERWEPQGDARDDGTYRIRKALPAAGAAGGGA